MHIEVKVYSDTGALLTEGIVKENTALGVEPIIPVFSKGKLVTHYGIEFYVTKQEIVHE